jgi:lipopolysaccharide transport system permease protein
LLQPVPNRARGAPGRPVIGLEGEDASKLVVVHHERRSELTRGGEAEGELEELVPQPAPSLHGDHGSSTISSGLEGRMTDSYPVAAMTTVPTASATARPERRVHRIEPSRGWRPVNLRELWRYRELSYFFLVRDIKARYKQTYLGPAWAIIRPLTSMILFSAIFGGLAGIQSGSNMPYPLFVTPGVIAFGYFSSALTGTSGSILNNSGLLSKAYFPRLYAPLAAVLTPIVDLLLALTVLLGLFAYYERLPNWRIVFLPAFLLLAAVVALGFGLWLAGVAVRYRDVAYGLPFVLQIVQYMTPVIYPVSFIPSQYRWLLALNPLTAVVAGFRWSILGTPFGSPSVLIASCSVAIVVTTTGLFAFRRTERTIVDML